MLALRRIAKPNVALIKHIRAESTAAAGAVAADAKTDQKAPRKTQVAADEIRNDITKLLEESSSVEAFDYLKSKISALKASKYGVPRFLGLDVSETVNTLINSSKKDAARNDLSAVPPRPYDILIALTEDGLARASHFENVIAHCISENAVQDALGLWVEYLQYVAKFPYVAVKNSQLPSLVTVAYIQNCIKSNQPQDIRVLQHLLNSQEIPPRTWVMALLKGKVNVANRAQLEKRINQLYLFSVDPNSVEYITKIHEAVSPAALNRLYAEYKQLADAKGYSESALVEFMNAFTNMNASTRGVQVWNDLVRAGIVPSSAGYCALMRLSAKHGNREARLPNIEGIWSAIKEKTEASYAVLIETLYSIGAADKVEKLVKGDLETALAQYSSVKDAYLVGMAKNNLTAALKTAEKFSVENEYQPGTAVVNAFIQQALRQNKYDIVEQLFAHTEPASADLKNKVLFFAYKYKTTGHAFEEYSKTLPKSSLNSRLTQTLAFEKLFDSVKDIEVLRNFFEHMVAKNVVTPIARQTMLKAELRLGSVAKAEELLESFKADTSFQPGSFIFNEMLQGLIRNNKMEKLAEHYQGMKSFGVQPHAETFLLLVRAAADNGSFAGLDEVLEDIGSAPFIRTERFAQNLKTLKEGGVEIPESVINMYKL